MTRGGSPLKARGWRDWFALGVSWAIAVVLGACLVFLVVQLALGRLAMVDGLVGIGVLLVLSAFVFAPLLMVGPVRRRAEEKWRAAMTPGSYGALFYVSEPRIGWSGSVVAGTLRFEQTGLATRTRRDAEQLVTWADVTDVEVRKIGKPLGRFAVLAWRERTHRRLARIGDENGVELSPEQLQELADELMRSVMKARGEAEG